MADITPFNILFDDEDLIAIFKPPGLFVHRSEDAAHEDEAVLTQLRKATKTWLYPLHRLDRPTVGVLVFAKNKATASVLGKAFEAREVDKTYLAVVRGWFPFEHVHVDYAIAREKGAPLKEAQTDFRGLARGRLAIPVGRYPEARYSLVEAKPKSGRYHQIRKHLAHLRYPIVGDTVHGDGRHNRLYREHFDLHRLLLLARSIRFKHPRHQQPIEIVADLDEAFKQVFEAFDWSSDRLSEPS